MITVVSCRQKVAISVLDNAFALTGVVLINFEKDCGGCTLMFRSKNAKVTKRLFNAIKAFDCLIMDEL
jgi:hypothetical protein